MLSAAQEEYVRALHEGQKEYKDLVARGLDPYPAVLDELLPDQSALTVQELPAQDIPADRIVGTKSAGRVSAFTASFLPLLENQSEFAVKWVHLCAAHLSDEGIREPILCYEYLGNFYVQEGNKRVSVLRHFGAAQITGQIRRVLPVPSEEPRIRAYYEFLDFYNLAHLYDLQFEKPGDYARLTAAFGKKPGELWTEQDRRRLRAGFHYFKEAFQSLGGGALGLRAEDALLLWLQVYPFSQLAELPARELKKSLTSLWDDVQTSSDAAAIHMQTAPEEEKKSVLSKLIPGQPKRLSVALLYQRNAAESTWTRGHEQGAEHLARTLGEQVTVRGYYNADSPAQTDALLEQAVADGADLIFTTTPLMLRSTLKAAVKYPKLRFLNCSTGTSLSSVRSYYCRTFEGKFITGVIAGAMAENDRIGYVGSYPIMGVTASINAFALGAKMTNPKAKIVLEWSCLPGDPVQTLAERGARVISNRDVPAKDKPYMDEGKYGTYLINDAGELEPLASPCWMWGTLYEKVVRSVLNGTWAQKKDVPEAINYWWGMDSGVIDVALTALVPEGVRVLADTLMRELREGTLKPFMRRIVAQDGTVKNDGCQDLSSLEMLQMDWLCENVEGRIPAYDELLPKAQPLVRELGLHRELIAPESGETP